VNTTKIEDVGDAEGASWTRSVLARLYLRFGYLEEARYVLAEALRIRPDDSMALRLSAQYFVLKNNLTQATQKLIEALSYYADPDIIIELAFVYKISNQIEKSKLLLSEVEKNLREDLLVGKYGHRMQLVKLLLDNGEQGSLLEARRLAEEEAMSRPHPITLMYLAKAQRENQDIVAAKYTLEKVVNLGFVHPYISLLMDFKNSNYKTSRFF